MIHVARDGAKLGEFTLEQIQAGMTSGQFRPTDLGWQTGMADWRPLSEFVGAAAVPPAAGSPPTVPVVAAGVTAAPAGAGLPWEHRAQLGFVKAWFDTVSLLITKPSDAFTMMRPEGGLMDPLLFGLIGGTIGAIVSMLFQFGLESMTGSRNSVASMFGIGVFVVVLVISPLLLACGLFVWSGILHLCLMMFGGANRPFETTFRVVCFSSGAAQLFAVIPFCGSYVGGIYAIVLECIGFMRAQQTTVGKALLSIILPIVVCCGALAAIFALIISSFHWPAH
ncbi:MAG TPA: YIP1 family protein [Chthoniobacterales bacterium]|nr:YIP1 family protein [Chthoniobacterales bacterium]